MRASTGITQLWANDDPEGRYPFSDAVTVYPDHVVARLAAIATLAALIRRRRTDRGAHIHISQAETAVSQLDVLYAAHWRARPGRRSPTTGRARVYPCAGDDEWCVITIGSDDEWHSVLQVLGGRQPSKPILGSPAPRIVRGIVRS